MTSKQRIFVDLLVVCMIFCIILIFSMISWCSKKEFRIKSRKINFKKTFISAVLMIIGKILDVLFRIMNCQSVGNQVVQFYFGYEHCYGSSLIFTFAIFSIGFAKIRFMTISQRQNESGAVYVLTNKYKPQYYYWEYILFIRRLIIALFAVSVNGITVTFIFGNHDDLSIYSNLV